MMEYSWWIRSGWDLLPPCCRGRRHSDPVVSGRFCSLSSTLHGGCGSGLLLIGWWRVDAVSRNWGQVLAVFVKPVAAGPAGPVLGCRGTQPVTELVSLTNTHRQRPPGPSQHSGTRTDTQGAAMFGTESSRAAAWRSEVSRTLPPLELFWRSQNLLTTFIEPKLSGNKRSWIRTSNRSSFLQVLLPNSHTSSPLKCLDPQFSRTFCRSFMFCSSAGETSFSSEEERISAKVQRNRVEELQEAQRTAEPEHMDVEKPGPDQNLWALLLV